jgi:hypothetical protein
MINSVNYIGLNPSIYNIRIKKFDSFNLKPILDFFGKKQNLMCYLPSLQM